MTNTQMTKTKKRLNPAFYTILTGITFIGLGFLWNKVVDILIDIEGFGLGDIIYKLPYAGYAVMILGAVLIFINIIRMVITKPVIKEEVQVKKKVQDVNQIKEISKFEKKFVKGLIFDLDGTLLDTLEDLVDAGNHVLATQGYPLRDSETYRLSLGKGLRNLMKNVLPPESSDEEVENAYLAMLESYENNFMNKTKPYHGVKDMLSQCAQRGYLISVVSNKKDSFTQALIRHHFPEILFVDILGRQELMPSKPDPALAKLVADEMMLPVNQLAMIGDSEVDIDFAKNSNMFSFAVTWGFRDQEVLEAEKPNVIVSSPMELVMELDMLNSSLLEA